jgi:hypothetical protein
MGSATVEKLQVLVNQSMGTARPEAKLMPNGELVFFWARLKLRTHGSLVMVLM